MTPRILEGGPPLPAAGQEPTAPGLTLPEARTLGGHPADLESLETPPAPSRYRIVLSCSFDEDNPSPKPE